MNIPNQAIPFWRHPALIIPLFLIAVNLACSLIAVEFRYRSLSGNSDVSE